VTLAQRFAQIFGAVYLLVGILGFLPVPPILVPDDLPVIGPLEGFVLGLVAVNWLHSLVHLAIGAAGLASYRSPVGPRSYAVGIGVLYLLLFVIGLILPTVFGLVPLNSAENILHLVSGAVALAIGLASPATETTTARA
jgi:Domain of unknown function (DUF4383)